MLLILIFKKGGEIICVELEIIEYFERDFESSLIGIGKLF